MSSYMSSIDKRSTDQVTFDVDVNFTFTADITRLYPQFRQTQTRVLDHRNYPSRRLILRHTGFQRLYRLLIRFLVSR
jgi:hypothetical protein